MPRPRLKSPTKNSAEKHSAEPIRTCLGCGQKLRKSVLVRFVVKEGEVVNDPAQKAAGRGAYCCDNEQCRQRFFKNRRRLARVFRIEIKRINGMEIGSEV